MGKQIKGEVLKLVRTQRGLTQIKLAEDSGVSKDTISRIELGKPAGKTESTAKKLAGALGIEAAVLTGEAPVPTSSDEEEWLPPALALVSFKTRISPAARNALWLASRRYGVSAKMIAELAPLLFVLTAERSLAERRENLERVIDVADATDIATQQILHMPSIFISEHVRLFADVEKSSIKRREIFADSVFKSDDLNFTFSEYDDSLDNPFASSLLKQAGTLAARTNDADGPKVERMSKEFCTFSVCRSDAMDLSGNDKDLADAILYGSILLSEMPRDLLDAEATAERIEWMKEQYTEAKSKSQKYWDDFLNG